MAAAYISPAAEGAKPSAARPRHSGVRKTLENLIHLIFLLCGVVAVAFVLLISIYLILSGIPAIREIGLGKFLFGKVWDPTNTTTGAQYGILAFILTSIYGTAGAILIGVPVGLLTAVFLARVAPPRLAAVIRTAVQLLAGIPSVVYGLVGMIVLVPAIQRTFDLSSGACLLAAILVLAVMILPSIINVSETALRAVPHEYEEASLALGATEMETSFRVVLPAARSGVAGGRARRGPRHWRGHGDHHGGGQRLQYARTLYPRALSHHRHRLRHGLCRCRQPVSAGALLHRAGAVFVHHAHQRGAEPLHQKAEGGLTWNGTFLRVAARMT